MTNVVVLTKNWVYWGERPLEDAIKLYFRGKIEIVKADESREIHAGISREGVTFKMPAPLVIRLLNFVGYKIKKNAIQFSEDAVYARDGNICQYWHYDENGKAFKYKCTTDERTLDHVVPKSKGGLNTFTNCVCACRHHNVTVKKNHMPEEVGLKLIRKPEVPRSRKGDMAVISFSFNPSNKAHQAFYEAMGMSFSHIAK
jgi:5-methylcytosine-specific restriction endonuclease McrA